QRARGIAIAEADHAVHLRCDGAESIERGDDVLAALAKAEVLALAVTDAAAVEAEHGETGLLDAPGKVRLAGERARTDLVAAADDQQAVRRRCGVERAGERGILACERERQALHAGASPVAIAAASASACSGDSSGSARSQRAPPPIAP